MKRFTFIADFEGGIYLSQVRVDDVSEAPTAWAAQLTLDDLGGLNAEQLEGVRQEMASDTLIAVRSLHAVWCISGLIGDSLLIIHVVDTRETWRS